MAPTPTATKGSSSRAFSKTASFVGLGVTLALLSGGWLATTWKDGNLLPWEDGNLEDPVADLRTSAYSKRVATFASARKEFKDARHSHTSGNATSGPVDAGKCYHYSSHDAAAMCLPSLVCIGAMKAGTFELKQWLSESPLVRTSSNEKHFFGHGEHLNFAAVESYVRWA
jgi:hypothetical protein